MKVLSIALIGNTLGAGLFDMWPVATWGTWSNWSSCDKNQQRVRTAPCLARPFRCYNPLIERTTEGCLPKAIWGTWGSWGACQYNIRGTSTRTPKRQREAPCLAQPPLCYNPLIEFQDCGPPRIWGEWSEYGPCDVVTQKRTRTAPCLAKRPHCYNPLIEQKDCTPTMPPPTVPPPTWGAWGAWGTCQNGKRTRVAPCLAGPPKCANPLIEEKQCVTVPAVPKQCVVTRMPTTCTTTSRWSPVELDSNLCAFNQLCMVKPQIFNKRILAPFAVSRVCSSTSIHALQRCLARQNHFWCAGLNGNIIENCWQTWKLNDFTSGNIVSPQG